MLVLEELVWSLEFSELTLQNGGIELSFLKLMLVLTASEKHVHVQIFIRIVCGIISFWRFSRDRC